MVPLQGTSSNQSSFQSVLHSTDELIFLKTVLKRSLPYSNTLCRWPTERSLSWGTDTEFGPLQYALDKSFQLCWELNTQPQAGAVLLDTPATASPQASSSLPTSARSNPLPALRRERLPWYLSGEVSDLPIRNFSQLSQSFIKASQTLLFTMLFAFRFSWLHLLLTRATIVRQAWCRDKRQHWWICGWRCQGLSCEGKNQEQGLGQGSKQTIVFHCRKEALSPVFPITYTCWLKWKVCGFFLLFFC